MNDREHDNEQQVGPDADAETEPSGAAEPAAELSRDELDGQLELAKAEVKEGVTGMAQAAGAGAAIGVLAMYLVGFLGFAAAFGLGEVMPLWGAFLVVAGVFLLLIAVLGLVARAKASSSSSVV